MIEFEKVSNYVFSEYYEAVNGDKKVILILDDNCVRYHVLINGKHKRKSEFDNNNKDKCLKNATKVLNK